MEVTIQRVAILYPTNFSFILLQCDYAFHDALQDVSFLQRLVWSANFDSQNSKKEMFSLLSATFPHERLSMKYIHSVYG